MTLPTTEKGVKALLRTLIPEGTDYSVDKVETTAWGVKAGFSVDSVSIDTDDLIAGAEVQSVSVGEEDFVTTDAVVLQVEACDDEEEEETPATIIVGTHSSGDCSDESHCASLYGELFLLDPAGNAAAWRDAAVLEQDAIMRRCVTSAIDALVTMVGQTSDRALKGLTAKPAVRDLMRRLAAVT